MNDEFCNTYIPYGMYRSVEIDRALYVRHPVRDASLTGCKEKETMHFLPSEALASPNVVS